MEGVVERGRCGEAVRPDRDVYILRMSTRWRRRLSNSHCIEPFYLGGSIEGLIGGSIGRSVSKWPEAQLEGQLEG